ncbi:hypothetical protein M5D96_008387 [Drosophila gunungcola]|uniref:Uncharacterized protein n=1 Tax=Drosophila gunungcola TaxID=103775 RepID=A0A9P9YL09_9MUSC|nr:hypothetical protein M5D96_008387 [Drosophila gunungcola]
MKRNTQMVWSCDWTGFRKLREAGQWRQWIHLPWRDSKPYFYPLLLAA